jgi:hypothetical protein
VANKTLITESRYGHIEALRVIAAFIVVWRHTEGTIFAGAFSSVFSAMNSFLDLGRVGVVLFFTISSCNKDRRGRRKASRFRASSARSPNATGSAASTDHCRYRASARRKA